MKNFLITIFILGLNSTIYSQLSIKCKDSITVSVSPWEPCQYQVKVADIDNGSSNYDTLWLSTGLPNHIIKSPGSYYVKLKGMNSTDANYCISKVIFADTSKPVVIVKQAIVLTFHTTDSIKMTKGLADNGSYDQCSELTFTFTPAHIVITDPSPINVIVSVSDAYGNTNTGTMEVTIVDKTSGIPNKTENIEDDRFTITPNPADDFIQIKADNNSIDRLVIYAANGQEALTLKPAIDQTYNINNLQSGHYILMIHRIDGSIRKTQFIKK